jgi:iron-sulfur cluster assembly protein
MLVSKIINFKREMEHAVEITQNAAKEIKDILERKNIPAGYGLRVTIKGGRGCAGVNFTLGFDKPNDNDISYVIDEIPVHIRKGELMFVAGKKIDFYEGADARGFVFEDQSDNSTEAL